MMDEKRVWTKVVGYTNLITLSDNPNSNIVNLKIHKYNLPWIPKQNNNF